MTTLTTNTHPLNVLCRGDLIRHFGEGSRRKVDYLLQTRRDLFHAIGKLGHSRIYDVSILPLMEELIEAPTAMSA